MERKLVTKRTIDKITAIEGADKIVAAHIGGWTAVIGKDEFFEGQEVFYFETDSMLPLDKEAFGFLRNRGIKEWQGREYHRLKAMRLRGVVSDGLILPTSILNEFIKDNNKAEDVVASIMEAGGDFTELFEVVKWEDPVLAKLGGKMTHFPEWITRTDEERVQNLPKLLDHIVNTNTFGDWYATEKIDGTSCTIWCRIDDKGEYEYGVCSRNYGLVEEEDNTYWQIARKPLIGTGDLVVSPLEYLQTLCFNALRAGIEKPNFVLQGEIFGEGIQNNPLGVRGQRICFFNFITDGKLVLEETLRENYPELTEHWVPIHPVSLAANMEAVIAQPDGVKTLVKDANKDAQIEGFVWRNRVTQELQVKARKSLEEIDFSKIPEDKWDLVKRSLEEKTRASFKAISDKYRLKHQE